MLYLCATPIGNLEDITLRVLRVLREADVIAAEDTRHTLRLLNHFNIKKPMISCHEHNERESASKITAILAEGKTVAYVSDAGMPGISDPGALLISACIEAGLIFTVLPGASASLTALVLSGISPAQFYFEGFLPRAAKDRAQRLKTLGAIDAALIIYESPLRLKATLKALAEAFGNRRAAVMRELTKLYEEARRGTLETLAEYYAANEARGECVIVVEGAENIETPADTAGADALMKNLLEAGLRRKDAARIAAEHTGVSRNELYNLSLE